MREYLFWGAFQTIVATAAAALLACVVIPFTYLTTSRHLPLVQALCYATIGLCWLKWTIGGWIPSAPSPEERADG